MKEKSHGNETHLAPAGKAKILQGQSILAPQPNSHNADGYIPCQLKMTVLENSRWGTRLRLMAVDLEDDSQVLVEIGTYWIDTGGSLTLTTGQGEPFIAALWPYRID